MPDFEVSLRYRLEWIASKIVNAPNEKSAQEAIEKQFSQVRDYESFEKFVEDDSQPELDDESLEVEQIDKI